MKRDTFCGEHSRKGTCFVFDILSTLFRVCFSILCSSICTKLTWKRSPHPPPPRPPPHRGKLSPSGSFGHWVPQTLVMKDTCVLWESFSHSFVRYFILVFIQTLLYCSYASTIIIIWAATWQNQQKWVCAQRRLRSAWASAQSDQSLRCPHEESLGP